MSTRIVWKGPKQLRKLLVPIESVQPHPQNPRRGVVPLIAESLERFGQQKPIVVVNGVIYAGNHLWKAARSLGWTHIAVVEGELTAEDAEAYLIADNRLTDLAGYDPEQLAEQLDRLRESANLVGTGYDSSQIERQLQSLRASAGEYVPMPSAEDEHTCPSCGHVWTGNPR